MKNKGKSTLVKKILSTYSGNSATVCSADLYFTNAKTGKYEFDQKKLKNAHQFSQDNAENACKYV